MSDVITSALTKASAGASIAAAGFNPGGQIDVIAGALAGAVIYAFTTSGLSVVQRIALSTGAFLVAIVCCDDVTWFIDWATPAAFHPTRALGAVVTAVIAVSILKFISISASNPVEFWKKLRGSDEKDKP